MIQLDSTFTVRRLVLMDLDSILALFHSCGRDFSWCTRETAVSLFSAGDFWGGFLGDKLVICCACVSPDAAPAPIQTMQNSLCGLLPSQRLLLPAAFTRAGCAFAAPFFSQLCRCALTDPRTKRPLHTAAAVPVKTGTPVLSGLFDAGFAAVRMRPLDALRPHYLLEFPRTAFHGARPLCLHVPVSDSYTICRLLETGWRAYDLRDAADGFADGPFLCLYGDFECF